MKLHVERYNEPDDYYECKDEQGNMHRLDLWVDGSLNLLPSEGDILVGRDIEIGHIQCYIGIGVNVRLLPEGATP